MNLFQQISVVLLSTLIGCPAAWSASLVVSDLGNGTYAIMGEGLNQVSGMDLTVVYDNSSLNIPVVTWGNLGSGAVKLANTGVPGSIRIAVVSNTPLPDSGQMAQISFNSGNKEGGVTSFTAKLISASGAAIPVSTSIQTSLQNSDTLAVESGATRSPSTTVSRLQDSSASSSTTSTILGTVNISNDNQINNEKKPNEPLVNVQPPERPTTPNETEPRHQELVEKQSDTAEKVVEQTQVNYDSVLERFKTYQGTRTPAAMMEMYEKPVATELHQEPLIAVSDGKAGVRIYANFPKDSTSSPNFRLSNVKLISLDRDDETGTLVLNVLPEKNSINATVSILTDQTVVSFPLTLIPPGSEATKSEEAFIAFLKDYGTQKPKFDLNNDGVHNYLDDYIYTGQYLMYKSLQTNPVKASQKASP